MAMKAKETVNRPLESGVCIASWFHWKLGDGAIVKFWTDRWVQDVRLCDRFVRLYNISVDKTMKVNQSGSCVEGQWRWSLRWRRQLFAWEEEELNVLMNMLAQVVFCFDEPDTPCWDGDGSGFSVKSCRMKIEGCRSPIQQMVVPNFWRWPSTLKAQALVWLACNGRIASKMFLAQRGILASDDTVCLRCRQGEEDSDHVMLDCRASWQVWSGIMKLWDCCWVQPKSFSHLLLGWESFALSGRQKKFWQILLLYTAWGIWLARNRVVFHHQEVASRDIVMEASYRSCRLGRYSLTNFFISGQDVLATGCLADLV